MSDLRAAIEALADDLSEEIEELRDDLPPVGTSRVAQVYRTAGLSDVRDRLRAILATPAPDTDALAERVGLVRVDSWKVVCQECREEFENGIGWTIYADAGYAADEAADCDWLVRTGLVLCLSCWEKNPYCRDEDNDCIRRDVSEADDGWLYCPDHIGQGMDTLTQTAEPTQSDAGEVGA